MALGHYLLLVIKSAERLSTLTMEALVLDIDSNLSLTPLEQVEVFKYVDAFIDSLRMEVMIFQHVRELVHVTESSVTVIDKNLILDETQDYEIFLRNPIATECFIPYTLDLYETRVELDIDRREGFRITALHDVGVTGTESISLDDPRVSEACLVALVTRMGFDAYSQTQYPALVAAIGEMLCNDDVKSKGIKSRLQPNQ